MSFNSSLILKNISGAQNGGIWNLESGHDRGLVWNLSMDALMEGPDSNSDDDGSTWLWFVFPCVEGTPFTEAVKRPIASLAVARDYVSHPYLGYRLGSAVQTLLRAYHSHADVVRRFGEPGAIRIQACLTLFAHVLARPAGFEPDKAAAELCCSGLRRLFSGDREGFTQAWIQRQVDDFVMTPEEVAERRVFMSPFSLGMEQARTMLGCHEREDDGEPVEGEPEPKRLQLEYTGNWRQRLDQAADSPYQL